MGRRDKLGVLGYSPVYKIGNQQGLIIYHREPYSGFYNNLYGKIIFKKTGYMYRYICMCVCIYIYTHIYITKSLCCTHKTILQKILKIKAETKKPQDL